MLHGYCIRRAGDPPPSVTLAGIDGEAVRLLEDGDLGIWLSATEGGPASLERLRRHEVVVRDALRTATPLPLRFGTHFRSEVEAVAALRERRDEFGEALRRLAGQVEMGIRVSLADGRPTFPGGARPAHPTAETGTAYLRRRREELRKGEEAVAEATDILTGLRVELADLDAPSVLNPAPRGDFVGTLAHLVHRAEVRPFRARVARLQEKRPDLRLVASGPWAPYSFVN